MTDEQKLHDEYQKDTGETLTLENEFYLEGVPFFEWMQSRTISQAARIAELKAALRGAGIFILSAKKVGFEDADEANEVIDKQLKKINAALETTAKAETEKV